MDEERRKFIRHPVDMPIKVYPQDQSLVPGPEMRDVSNGGISFFTNVALTKNSLLTIAIPHVAPPFEEKCVVCWCRNMGDGFEIGVRFMNQEGMFRAHMVEQVCHIRDYRLQASRQGRPLSSDEAAKEWISKHAEGFRQH